MGLGRFGRLGQGDPADSLSDPRIFAICIVIRHVACGDSHCLVVAEGGKLFTSQKPKWTTWTQSEDRLKPTPVESLWADGGCDEGSGRR